VATQAGDRLAVTRPYPNPASGVVSLGFAFAGDQTRAVEAEVFDVQGRTVRTLLRETLTAGAYRISWDRTNEAGRTVTHGIYFIRLRSDSFAVTEKILVID